MAISITSDELVGTGTLKFLNKTKTWVGGGGRTAANSQVTGADVEISSVTVYDGKTLKVQDCTFVATQILTEDSGPNPGTLDMINATYDMSSTPVSKPSRLSMKAIDTKLVGAFTSYNFIGVFGALNAPFGAWNLDNFQVEVDIGATDRTEAYCLLFPSAADTNTSTYNNIALWNGQTGIATKGGVAGFNSVSQYAGIKCGPFGLWMNSIGDYRYERVVLRIANEGTLPPTASGLTSLTNTNHWGPYLNLDIRSLGNYHGGGVASSGATRGLTTDAGKYRSWVIDVDAGASPWIINPYIGRPSRNPHFSPTSTLGGSYGGASGLQSGYLSFVGLYGGTTNKGVAQTFLGTKPVVTDGSTEHKLTFDTATVTNTNTSLFHRTSQPNHGVKLSLRSKGVYLYPATYATQTLPTNVTSRVISGIPSDGLLFRNQYCRPGNIVGLAATLQTDHYERLEIQSLYTPTYRKYSWIQQSDTTWGKLITLTPPPENATDAQIATAVAAGYDTLDATGFTTTTNIDDALCPIVAEVLRADAAKTTPPTALTTAALAITRLSAINGVTTGSEIGAVMKAERYQTIIIDNVHTSVSTSNGLVTLPFSMSGTNISMSVGAVGKAAAVTSVTISDTATAYSYNPTTNAIIIPVPTAGVELDGVVRSFTAASATLNIRGTALSGIKGDGSTADDTAAAGFAWSARNISFKSTTKTPIGFYTATSTGTLVSDGFSTSDATNSNPLPEVLSTGTVLSGKAIYGHSLSDTSNFAIEILRKSDAKALTIVHQGTGTLTITGMRPTDFDTTPVATGSGTIVYNTRLTIKAGTSAVPEDIVGFRKSDNKVVKFNNVKGSVISNSNTTGVTAGDWVFIACRKGVVGIPTKITIAAGSIGELTLATKDITNFNESVTSTKARGAYSYGIITVDGRQVFNIGETLKTGQTKIQVDTNYSVSQVVKLFGIAAGEKGTVTTAISGTATSVTEVNYLGLVLCMGQGYVDTKVGVTANSPYTSGSIMNITLPFVTMTFATDMPFMTMYVNENAAQTLAPAWSFLQGTHASSIFGSPPTGVDSVDLRALEVNIINKIATAQNAANADAVDASILVPVTPKTIT